MIESKPNDKSEHSKDTRSLLERIVLTPKSAHLLFWPIVTAGIALDLWSKHAVFKWLPNQPNQEYSVIDGFFKLVLRVNDGAAFSIASGRREFLVATSLIAMVVVLGIFILGNITQRLKTSPIPTHAPRIATLRLLLPLNHHLLN